MALRIQNNIAAINAQRNLNVSNTGLSKSLERLSSGFRINRAADDAAGLAISQQFRADIASFKVASRNAAEANSLLQVAEGALDQQGNILTRLKELATQAASGNAGTNIAKINAEANQLIEEFDRIATSTQYAGTALLTGNMAAGSPTGTVAGTSSTSDVTTTGANGDMFGITSDGVTLAALTGLDTSTAASFGVIDSTISSLADDDNEWTLTVVGTTSNYTISNGTMTFDAHAHYVAGAGNSTITIDGMGENQGNLVINATLTSSVSASTGKITFNNLGLNEDDVTVASSAVSQAYTFSTVGNNIVLTGADGSNQSLAEPSGAATLDFSNLGISIDVGNKWATGDLDGLTITVANSGGGASMDFQIGSQNAADNRLSINLADARANATEISLVADMLSTQSSAQTALDTIDAAISTVTEQRGNVGAYMNRLSYASSNLETTIENVQAAESVIRDVDMAAEMTTFVKNQILMQAGTAMLAQANMAPQSVLSLLG